MAQSDYPSPYEEDDDPEVELQRQDDIADAAYHAGLKDEPIYMYAHLQEYINSICEHCFCKLDQPHHINCPIGQLEERQLMEMCK